MTGPSVSVANARALVESMNSDAIYATSSVDSQKNLGLEFSRRARGIPVWATLRSLGRTGVAEMVENHCRLARRLADGLKKAGFEVLNRVVLNQVLVRLETETRTKALRQLAIESGEIWFGQTVWQGQAAFRLSLSSWRTRDEDVDHAIELLTKLKSQLTIV